MSLLLSFLLITHYITTDSIPNTEVYDSPFHGRFAAYKDYDSLTGWQLLLAGPLVCDNNAFEVISFQIGIASPCYSGPISIKGNELPRELRENLAHLHPGSCVYFDMIKVKNNNGRMFWVKAFMLRIRRASLGQPKQDCEPTLLTKAHFEGFKDKDTLTLEQLKNAKRVVCQVPALRIESFRFGLKGNGPYSEYLETLCKGDSLSSMAQELINNIQDPSRLYLSCIVVVNKDGKIFILKNSHYLITIPKSSLERNN